MMAAAVPRFPSIVTAPAVARPSVPIYRLLGIELALVVVLARLLGFGYDGRDIDAVAMLLALVIGAALLARRHRLPRLATALEASALALAASMLAGCLSLVLAPLALPYRDGALAAADAWLLPFASWPAMVRALAPHDRLVAAMCEVYSSLLWQPFLLIVLLSVAARERVAWRFLHAWCLALAVCLAVFALVPAVAAYRHYGITAAAVPSLSVSTGWRPAAILDDLRSGALRQIASGGMAGLITFPSFHAAGATLLAWGFRRVPIVGWAFVMLDAAMILTIPMVGSHYFVDVLAGIATAALALRATRPDQ